MPVLLLFETHKKWWCGFHFMCKELRSCHCILTISKKLKRWKNQQLFLDPQEMWRHRLKHYSWYWGEIRQKCRESWLSRDRLTRNLHGSQSQITAQTSPLGGMPPSVSLPHPPQAEDKTTFSMCPWQLVFFSITISHVIGIKCGLAFSLTLPWVLWKL